VLFNLISNAVKFTRTRPRAEIEIGCRKDGSEDVFFIKDNGVGFNMDFVDRLFGVFQRSIQSRNSKAQASVWPMFVVSLPCMRAAHGPRAQWTGSGVLLYDSNAERAYQMTLF